MNHWKPTALLMAALFASPGATEELDCLIRPEASVVVSSPVEGRIDEIRVDVSDRVRKGQILAVLENSLEKTSLGVARERANSNGRIRSSGVRLEFAKRELKRRQQLGAQNVLSTREREEAERDKQVAEANLFEAQETQAVARAELRRAEAALERRTIRSPIPGFVEELLISAGEYADPPEIMRIVQSHPLRVEVFVPEHIVRGLLVGTPAEVTPEGHDTRTASVSVIHPVVDTASGRTQVRLVLANDDYALKPGVTCRLRFPEATELDAP